MKSLEIKILNIAIVALLAVTVIQAGNQAKVVPADSLAAARISAQIPDSITLRDRADEISLRVDLTGDDIGMFDLFVPEEGFYHGTIPLRWSGKQIVHPTGSTFAEFTPLEGGVGSSSAVSMQGEINVSHKTASLNVWVDYQKYRLTAHAPDIKKAQRQAEQNAQTFVTRDWDALYDFISDNLKHGLSKVDFEAAMTVSPHVLGATVNGEGTLYELSGYHYFAIPIQIAVLETDGSTSMYVATQYLVLENGEWRFLSTTTPEPL